MSCDQLLKFDIFLSHAVVAVEFDFFVFHWCYCFAGTGFAVVQSTRCWHTEWCYIIVIIFLFEALITLFRMFFEFVYFYCGVIVFLEFGFRKFDLWTLTLNADVISAYHSLLHSQPFYVGFAVVIIMQIMNMVQVWLQSGLKCQHWAVGWKHWKVQLFDLDFDLHAVDGVCCIMSYYDECHVTVFQPINRACHTIQSYYNVI